MEINCENADIYKSDALCFWLKTKLSHLLHAFYECVSNKSNIIKTKST